MSTGASAKEHLRREIGRLGFSAITLNGLIGAGIFALPAIAVAKAGAFSPWMFLICALVFLSVVASFARAASFFDHTGGPSVYAGAAFGLFAGFQTGWLLYLGRITAMAANTTVLVSYAGLYLTPLQAGWGRALGIVAVVALLTGVNVVGVRRGMLTVYALTLLKLIPLGLLVLLGLSWLSPGLLITAPLPAPATFSETMMILLYAFVGFEGAVIPAGEGRDPRADIPRAMILTVAATALFYFLIQWVSISVIGDFAGSTTPLADVGLVLMGAFGAGLLTVGAIFSIGGNISALMLAAPRMTYALARDGSLPAWFGRVHPRFRTPANSILFLGAFAMLLALSGSFVLLAVMSTLARLLGYAACVAALPRLERVRPDRPGQFRLPGGFVIPAMALAVCLWLTTQASLRAWLTTLVLIGVGTVLFALTRRGATRGGDDEPVAERDRPRRGSKGV